MRRRHAGCASRCREPQAERAACLAAEKTHYRSERRTQGRIRPNASLGIESQRLDLGDGAGAKSGAAAQHEHDVALVSGPCSDGASEHYARAEQQLGFELVLGACVSNGR